MPAKFVQKNMKDLVIAENIIGHLKNMEPHSSLKENIHKKENVSCAKKLPVAKSYVTTIIENFCDMGF